MFGVALCDLFEEAERKRKVKTASGNRKTGFNKQVKIPKGNKPRGEGQGQRPTEK